MKRWFIIFLLFISTRFNLCEIFNPGSSVWDCRDLQHYYDRDTWSFLDLHSPTRFI